MSDTDEQAPTAASTTSPNAEPVADNGKKAEDEGQGETHSRSGSEQPATKRSGSHSRSHSRSRSYRRYGRSHSRSRRRRSRSRSGSLEYRHRHRSTSHSPLSNRRRHIGNRQCHCEMPPQANPNPSGCLGVFGLSLYTSERDLRDVFSRYGPISEVKVVFDQQTGRSRGFAFVYFETDTDAKEAKDRANGMELDGRNIRVDFSITKRPHTPTPGVYMGRPTYPTGYREAYRDPNFYDRGCERSYDRGYERNYDRGYERDYDRNYNRYDDYNYRMERYRRTPSPYYRGRYRSRSRSYSPRRY